MTERDELIKRTLLEAFEKYGDRPESIDLWVVIALAPDVLKTRSTPVEDHVKTMAIGIGPVTRAKRFSFTSNGLRVITKECMPIDIPFDAIYCLIADGVFAEELNWARELTPQRDWAFVNFEEPFHNLIKG